MKEYKAPDIRNFALVGHGSSGKTMLAEAMLATAGEIGRLGSIDHLPAMRITHLGGGASRKGLRHILLFSRSALRFFRSHGWRWF